MVESYNYPFGIDMAKASYSASGRNNPSQNLVDAYEMKATGKGINEAGSGYDEQNPYVGRDPRFWDVRRWKEADKFFKNIQEMKITKNDDGSFTYTRETVQRQWDDKMYLFPIPNDVMLKHEKYGQKWEQNPGW